MRRQRAQRGYTILEMLIALVVTMVGFAAIFQLQIGSMQGNIAARELAAATNLGERFADTLRRDGVMWTGTVFPAPYLNKPWRRWHSFTPAPVDQNGRAYVDDDPANGTGLARQRFCVHYWLEPADGQYDGILNGRVRVLWPRSSVERVALYDVCGSDDADNFVPNVREWFTLTMPVIVRRHPG